jgi:hypothetical protein
MRAKLRMRWLETVRRKSSNSPSSRFYSCLPMSHSSSFLVCSLLPHSLHLRPQAETLSPSPSHQRAQEHENSIGTFGILRVYLRSSPCVHSGLHRTGYHMNGIILAAVLAHDGVGRSGAHTHLPCDCSSYLMSSKSHFRETRMVVWPLSRRKEERTLSRKDRQVVDARVLFACIHSH